jgi:Fur family transcriptional regulator, ferric uptake regulator
MSCFEILKERGYRLTPQRIMVLELLHETDSHISALEIVTRVQARYPCVNKSTVYRTLDLLKELDLVTETELGGDTLFYHHAEKGHHHHLICAVCGEAIEVGDDVFATLETTLRDRFGFSADLKHLAIQGRCANCRI